MSISAFVSLRHKGKSNETWLLAENLYFFVLIWRPDFELFYLFYTSILVLFLELFVLLHESHVLEHTPFLSSFLGVEEWAACASVNE